MGAALVAAAEVTNSFAVVSVLTTLLITIVFILRLQNDEMFQGSVVRPRFAPKPIPMVAVRNPFVFTLVKTAECCLNGVYCEISSEIPVLFQVFWGVDVSDLNKLLQLEWNELNLCLNDDSFLEKSVVCKQEIRSFEACEKDEVLLRPSVELDSKLGPPPRTKYPLVIVMAEKEECECEPSADGNDSSQRVVAMICVIHIKDDFLKDESYIYAQYLKQNTGQIVALKPLYVSSSDEPEPTDCELSSNCVVCQCEPVTRALLPCRHACICRNCFSHVDKCPMCRAHIANYFCIKEETQTNAQNASVSREQLNWMQKFEFYMGRMNEYFGFS